MPLFNAKEPALPMGSYDPEINVGDLAPQTAEGAVWMAIGLIIICLNFFTCTPFQTGVAKKNVML